MARYDIGTDNKVLLELLALQSRKTLNSDDYRSVFEIIIHQIISQYENDEKIIIPMIGEFKIEKLGDKVIENKKNGINDEQDLNITQMMTEKIEESIWEEY